ncbi:MAG: serine/threonine-protein kinase [Rhodocyclaceae bacterium]
MSRSVLKLVSNAQPADDSERRTIGRYVVSGELGRGAMGMVFRAEDPLIERPVALKMLALELEGPQRASFKERFLREAKSAGRLSHPNIVTIYDVGEHEDVPYIAMEFLAGLTVRECLDSGVVLPVRKVLDVGILVVRGLDYAHKHGVIHRDIKPANIMLARNGVVKIMDFGIAWASDTGKTATEGVIGSPRYMAPEQIAAEQADARTDVFALGVTLYEMLAGRNPFDSYTIPEVMHKILHVSPQPPSAFNPDVPSALDAIVLKAIAKNPAGRFQNAKEMGRALLEVRRALRGGREAAAEEEGAGARGDVDADTVVPAAVAARASQASSASQASQASQASSAAPLASKSSRSRRTEPKRSGGRMFLALAAAGLVTLAVVAGVYLADDSTVLLKPQDGARSPRADAVEVAGAPAAVASSPVAGPAEAEGPGMLADSLAGEQGEETIATPEAGEQDEGADLGSADAERVEAVPDESPVAMVVAVESASAADAARPPAPAQAPAAAPPARSQPAARGPGTVSLAVTPWGEVFVDGRSRGVTPPLRALELPAGRYRIEIRNGDFAPYVETVTLESGGAHRISHRFR